MSTNHRQRAEELLTFSNKAGCTNEEAALAIAEAQVHATLALSNNSAPPKTTDNTGDATVFAYRVVIDHDPALKSGFGLPLHKIPSHFWLLFAHQTDPKDYPEWIPQDLWRRVMDVRFIFDSVPLREVESNVYGRSDAQDTVWKLSEWGVRAHIEKAPINLAWEVVA